MLTLADSTIRQYRRGDGRVAFRLRSYLLIEGSFRLSAYLRSISARLTLSTGERIELDEISFAENCMYRAGVMMYDFWASGIADLEVIRDDIGTLRMDYHVSFTGHPYEEPEFLERRVPVVSRGRVRDRFGRSGLPREGDH